MTQDDLLQLGRKALLSAEQNVSDYEGLAEAVFDLYSSGEVQFRQHIKNRSKRVVVATGVAFDADNFDVEMARAFVADELGFASWNALTEAVLEIEHRSKPIVFDYAVAAMLRGDFTALEEMLGAEDFDETIIQWFERGYFENATDTLNEIFAAACMLGHPRLAGYLLGQGIDPYAGMRTGLAGFHYAASSGRLDVIRLLIERKVPMEVKNSYGGTVFDQAIWSAIHEHTPFHAEIVEELVKAGARVEDGYLEWWNEQDVPDSTTKQRIADILSGRRDLDARVAAAREKVDEAEAAGGKRLIADSLKSLGNILRRPPFLRDAANDAYQRAADLYDELGLPLEAAWVKRHIGINHEYAGRLEEAEKYYDEALALYREHSSENDGNFANAVRYPAVIKERLGKKEESAKLWEEAYDRYARLPPDGLVEGVVEAAAWLAILAIERGELGVAYEWFSRARDASPRSSDPDTHKFIVKVRERLETAQKS